MEGILQGGSNLDQFGRQAEEAVYKAICDVISTPIHQNMYLSCKLTVVSRFPLNTLDEKQTATRELQNHMLDNSWEPIFKFACAINTAKLEFISREGDRYYYMAKLAGRMQFYLDRYCFENDKHISFQHSTIWLEPKPYL